MTTHYIDVSWRPVLLVKDTRISRKKHTTLTLTYYGGLFYWRKTQEYHVTTHYIDVSWRLFYWRKTQEYHVTTHYIDVSWRPVLLVTDTRISRKNKLHWFWRIMAACFIDEKKIVSRDKTHYTDFDVSRRPVLLMKSTRVSRDKTQYIEFDVATL